VADVLSRLTAPAALALALAALGTAGAQTAPAPAAPQGGPAAAATTAPQAPAEAPTPIPLAQRPPCARALVAVLDDVDSARAHAGDPFSFRIVDAATAPDGSPIPAGNIGYGVVAIASHAGRGGQGGYLVLETRFLAPANGPHVPVVIDRGTDAAAVALGGSANAPGLLGMIPFVGYAVGGYDSLHHGKDATIPKGTRIPVLLGDGAALGTCRSPRPGETAPPAISAPAATPAPPAASAPPATPAAQPAAAGPTGGPLPTPAPTSSP
jgi:hypothetical protein